MTAAVDRWLGVAKPTADDEINRVLELDDLLENYGFCGPFPQVLTWYNTYQQFGRYPFGNGVYGEQPAWLLEDFQTLELLQERQRLFEKHAKQARK